ncbi:hypothetical protein CAQU_10040 [Corynebacterium aquilae DSM 44791]|uniref:Uncharacterized protein n=2 Tax=Corynebacterium aquilae TaxID=203263 RepID=A0A1L7CHK3_9CORY|nr:hypothetical protein CAQU_10040 [Corynebacterium aquilae DSM 44791]
MVFQSGITPNLHVYDSQEDGSITPIPFSAPPDTSDLDGYEPHLHAVADESPNDPDELDNTP